MGENPELTIGWTRHQNTIKLFVRPTELNADKLNIFKTKQKL